MKRGGCWAARACRCSGVNSIMASSLPGSYHDSPDKAIRWSDQTGGPKRGRVWRPFRVGGLAPRPSMGRLGEPRRVDAREGDAGGLADPGVAVVLRRLERG